MSTNIDTVLAIYDAFGRGDVATILGYLDDDVEWDLAARETPVPYLQAGHGKDHVLSFFGKLAATFNITSFAPGTPCAGGDLVLVPIVIAGNIVGGGDIPSNLEAHMWRFGTDGKVVGFDHIGDFAIHEDALAAVNA